ncbi:MAG: InlB B-repeat-containing protein [Prevotellaceae bacterium]|nr:InlB B-repeat-containing protein [Prevotellaceae bacterium]
MSGTSAAYNFQTKITGDITLVAKWESETEYQQISWELNGGEWTANDNHVTRIVKGEMLPEPAEPEKAYSIFEGWYKDADLTDKVSFPYYAGIVTSAFTLYAKWYDLRSEYFGVWKSEYTDDDGKDAWEQFSINENSIVFLDYEGSSFTLEDLIWAETYNPGGDFTASYTDGYWVMGTLTKTNDFNFSKSDGSGIINLGETIDMSFYINGSKQRIMVGNMQTTEREAYYGPYTLQLTRELKGGAGAEQTVKGGKTVPAKLSGQTIRSISTEMKR